MAKEFTIRQKWQQFERSVMPIDASPIQKQEMRRAFYAGAFALLDIVAQIGSDESISEEAGALLLDKIEAELKAFQARIGIDA
ncbi:hypothetical protein [Leptolyngbya ohadii]|uniref:hypothetical protein n=1 Tax=Leptolyngbya ohadii TaxID=1962290 RepID=UPI000B59CB7A|nr:hypothetical protein [Leptolyngbya ohadii]